MRGRSCALLFACALLLVGGCSRGQEETAEPVASASATTAATPLPSADELTPTASATAEPSAPSSPSAVPATTAEAPAGSEDSADAPTQLVGVTVAAPEGYRVVALPDEYADQLAQLAEQTDQQVAALEAAGITDADGNEAAVVLVTQYAGIDVTTPEFDAQRRTQAETQGAVLTDEVIAGTAMLTSATPPLVSWTQGQDTLVVVSSAGVMGLEELREVANAMLSAG